MSALTTVQFIKGALDRALADDPRVFLMGEDIAAYGGSFGVTRGLVDKYGPERIILGADVRDGKVSINGWKEDSGTDLLPFLRHYVEQGVTHVLCTDISRDGMLSGPSVELYSEVMRAYPSLHLIASGGVSSNEDIMQLQRCGIPAVVFGKAYYEGRIDVGRLRKTLSEDF